MKQNSKIILGIDPGRFGHVAAVVDGGKRILLYKLRHDSNGMLDCAGLVEFCRSVRGEDWHENCFVVLEKLHYIPKKMGGGSIFEMARSFGAIEACLRLLRFKHLKKVRPCDWKREMGLLGKDKSASVLLAEDFCKRLSIRVEYSDACGKAISKKLTHDAAEAILLTFIDR